MDLISRKLIIEEANERQKNGDYITKGFIKSLPSAFEGMTNGDVMKAVFPNASIFENRDNEPYPYVDVFLYGESDMNCYRKTWWDSPYKAESEVKQDD